MDEWVEKEKEEEGGLGSVCGVWCMVCGVRCGVRVCGVEGGA